MSQFYAYNPKMALIDTGDKKILLANVLLLVMCCTPLSILVTPFLPVIVLLLWRMMGLGFTKTNAIVLLVAFLSSLTSILVMQSIWPINLMLSWWLILPLFILLFSSCKKIGLGRGVFDHLLSCLTAIMIINDLIGICQFAYYLDDDSFTGLFGSRGLGAHGVGIVNGFLLIYWIYSYKFQKNLSKLLKIFLFALSFILAFYGAGLLLLVLSLMLVRFGRFAEWVRGMILVLSLIILLRIINPTTFFYNYAAFSEVINPLAQTLSTGDIDSGAPRKVTLFYNYLQAYLGSTQLFLFGTGPGTFNSRTAFVLSGDYLSSNYVTDVTGVISHPYFEQMVFPLWNRRLLKTQFMDGTMNQPFSSGISLAAEYGAIFIIILAYYTGLKIRNIRRLSHLSGDTAMRLFHNQFIKCISFFILLIILIENIIEYPEILLIYLLMIKTLELQLNHEVKMKLILSQ